MITTISILLSVVIILTITVYLGLPKMLNALGLNSYYRGRNYKLSGCKALVVTTSHGVLGDAGKKTGVYASEMTIPYYQFIDAMMQVDVASIKGGAIPIEPNSLRWPLSTLADRRYLADPVLKDKVKNSLKIDDVDFASYDLVFIAGGWGAAYDLGTSDTLGRKIGEAYLAKVVLGAICHGPLGFLKARDDWGNSLVKGRKITAVTDKQVRELGIETTPQHPERELRGAGAIFESESAFRDIFANHVVIDGNIVTGQNQNSGAETAQKMMNLVEQKKARF